MPTAANVELPRFMGDWYVVANIPTSQEKDAWNAVESYRLHDGTKDVVDVTFTFRHGAFDGRLETLHPTGHVSENPAVWGMKFFWWQGPFRFEYRIVDLDPSYQVTVIGRSARDYVWVMARSPTLGEAEWARVTEVVRAAGYDPGKLRRIQQRWGVPPDVSPAERH
jgi:apolipoprotein D and lipocalin family protein